MELSLSYFEDTIQHFSHSATKLSLWLQSNTQKLLLGGARGVMVIVEGNEHDDTSSNPGQDW